MVRSVLVAALLALVCAASMAAAADTEGVVSRVVVLPVTNGKHVLRIYFASYVNDRWGCLQGIGYIEANDTSAYVDAKALDRALVLATTALTAGIPLGIDSPGTNP